MCFVTNLDTLQKNKTSFITILDTLQRNKTFFITILDITEEENVFHYYFRHYRGRKRVSLLF